MSTDRPTWFFPIPPWEASRCCPECERNIYHDEPGFELDGPCEECESLNTSEQGVAHGAD